jgi:N-methylhydantoinase A
MATYLDHLDEALERGGFDRQLSIMKSNGGVMTATSARSRPVDTFLSGPAGGVVAAKFHGAQADTSNVIAVDMGGTSFDVSLITEGELGLSMSGSVDESTPLGIPMLDIRTIGAGGGSIAWIDPGGVVKVGPASAGADPGPACYGRGGQLPTVTDANVLLGRIGTRTILGGQMEIDPALARSAIEREVAEPLGISAVEAASGILRITVANMVTAIRSITAETGVDPREYAILAGGGGGPLHAALIAEEFDIPSVVVPSYPGLLSAGGLVLSDLKVDLIKSYPIRLERDGVEELNAVTAGLLQRAAEDLRSEGYEGAPQTTVALDMRYLGQNWEITVPLGSGAPTPGAIADRFDAMHTQLYGFDLPDHVHEILAIRVGAVGPTEGARDLVPGRYPDPPGVDSTMPVAFDERRVWVDDDAGFVECPIFDREHLASGAVFDGPAIAEGADSAVWVPARWSARVDPSGSLILTRS